MSETKQNELRDAAQNLVTALDVCESAITGAFQFAHIHGMDYAEGVSYGKELEALKAMLANQV